MLAGLGFGGRRGWTSVEGAPGAGVVATYGKGSRGVWWVSGTSEA